MTAISKGKRGGQEKEKRSGKEKREMVT